MDSKIFIDEIFDNGKSLHLQDFDMGRKTIV